MRVVLDSTLAAPGVEVLATTLDPAALAPLARTARDSLARRMGSGLTRAPIADGRAVLRLPAGTWWLALTGRDGRLRLPAVETVVRDGEHRTLELGTR